MKCPGQDSRYWKPGSIFETKCPNCGEPVEFFKDDPTRKCGNCGNKCVNPNMDFGCAAYCKFADQCIGELPPELLAEREELMKDRIEPPKGEVPEMVEAAQKPLHGVR
ncbi:MAG: hypothetical protein R6T78_02210 [Dehalococcoidales bacterium]